MEQNPYQPPAAQLEINTDQDIGNAEEIRNKLINHEASIRSVGMLYYVGTVALVLFAIFQLASFNTEHPSIALLPLILFGGLAALYYWIGSGLRQLRKNVSIVAGIFAVIGLLSFPVGTIINGYILYLLFSEKGKTVFSEEYKTIVDATPHIKPRTPVIVWIVVALLITGIIAAIVIPMMSTPHGT